ncbi:MAG: ABC transporter substrate-binding protein [Pseudomonadota bacterium]
MKTLLTTTALVLAAATAQAQELNVAAATMAANLEPGDAGSNVNAQFWINSFEALIDKDPTTTDVVFMPGLATEWDIVSPTEIRLTIREGVKFHNGDDMTIEDVLFTFRNMKDPVIDKYAREASYYWSNVDVIEAVDDTTLRITYHRPEPLMEMFLNRFNNMIIPKDYLMSLSGDPEVAEDSDYIAFGQAPVGTGPYKITQFTPQERIVYERFDDYWGEKAPYEKITVRLIPETAARITALVNGEVDLITNIAPDQLATIDNNPGTRTVGLQTPIFHVVFFGTGERNPKITAPLRKAMMLAVDRDLINEALWLGKAGVPSTHSFAQQGAFHTPDLVTFRHDLEEAKKIVAEHNLEGTELTFHTHPVYYTNGVLAAQAMQEMWREIGIDVNLNVAVERPSGNEREVANWSNPLYMTDPHGGYGYMWAPDGHALFSKFWEPSIGIEAYTKLYDAFRFETDVEKRNAAFARVMAEVEKDAPYFVKYQPYESWGIRDDLDWEPYPGHRAYVLDFRAGYIGDAKYGITK